MGLFDFFTNLSSGTISASVNSIVSLYWSKKELNKEDSETEILNKVLTDRILTGFTVGNKNALHFEKTKHFLTVNKENNLSVLIFYILMIESEFYRKAFISDPTLFAKDIHKHLSKKMQYKDENIDNVIVECMEIAFKVSNYFWRP